MLAAEHVVDLDGLALWITIVGGLLAITATLLGGVQWLIRHDSRRRAAIDAAAVRAVVRDELVDVRANTSQLQRNSGSHVADHAAVAAAGVNEMRVVLGEVKTMITETKDSLGREIGQVRKEHRDDELANGQRLDTISDRVARIEGRDSR